MNRQDAKGEERKKPFFFAFLGVLAGALWAVLAVETDFSSFYSTSKIASISTGMLFGSAPIPTAERA
jgi:hypothetical protein